MHDAIVRFCRSRNGGRRCTRPLGHAGLHKQRTIMWSDTSADEPRCAASGTTADPAPMDRDGYPHGRGLCPACQRFIPLTDGRLDPHDTSDAAESAADIARRREWLNTHGW